MFEIEGDAQPEQCEQQIDGPLNLGRIVVVPEEEGTKTYGWKTGPESQKGYAPLKFDPAAMLKLRIKSR